MSVYSVVVFLCLIVEATSVLIRIVCLNSIVGNIAKTLPVYVSIKYDL